MSTVEANGIPFDGGVSLREPVIRVWALAIATYGVGDGLTTAALVWYSPLLREANPVVSAAIGAFGGSGLVGLKVAAIGLCLGISVWGAMGDDRFTFYLPPITLTIVGTVTTLVNLNLLL